jgi:hypothetical protein
VPINHRLLQPFRALFSQRYILVLLTGAVSICIGFKLGYLRGTVDQLERSEKIFEIVHHADSLIRTANAMTTDILNDSVSIHKEVAEMKTTIGLTGLQMKEIIQIRFKQYAAL